MDAHKVIPRGFKGRVGVWMVASSRSIRFASPGEFTREDASRVRDNFNDGSVSTS